MISAKQRHKHLSRAIQFAAGKPENGRTQQAALQNFDQVWAQVVAACTGPGTSYGSAGQNCVNDRKQGACHYQVNGQCWNWFIGYRDAIANDPAVVPDPATTTGGMPPSSSGLPATSIFPSGIDPNLLVIAGLGLVILVVAVS
jgi:hypothetical protein